MTPSVLFEVLMHNGNPSAALKDAGDNWLTIGSESWNRVERREWAAARERELGSVNLDGILESHTGQSSGLAEAGEVNTAAQPLFSVVSLADLAHVDPPAPAFWWDDYLPAGVVTLLSAQGGTGKTFLALMAGVSIALGMLLLGIPTRRGKVALFSGEDGPDIMRHRLKFICRAMDVHPSALDGRLHILDATQGDPTLFHEVNAKGTRYGATTSSYEALRAYVEEHEIDVLIVDNASDTFDAQEIDRARVRGFMRALARIAQVKGGAVLLLAHVDKGSSRRDRTGTEGYSGSTAWHNSARSRLFMSRDK